MVQFNAAREVKMCQQCSNLLFACLLMSKSRVAGKTLVSINILLNCNHLHYIKRLPQVWVLFSQKHSRSAGYCRP